MKLARIGAIFCVLLFMPNLSIVEAKTKKTQKSSGQESRWDGVFKKVAADYRNGKISKKRAWSEFTKLHDKFSELSQLNKIRLLQQSSKMLFDAGYPISSALFASQAIILSNDPNDKELSLAWNLISTINGKYSIDTLMETLAISLIKKHKKDVAPKVLKGDWHYFIGNALAKRGKSDLAIEQYSKLKTSDRHFALATYQKAMLLVDENKLDEAEQILSMLVHNSVQNKIKSKHISNNNIFELSYLALGRINYEQKDFDSSFRSYRFVSKSSPYFYDALFEQSWAFFMAGYPNHALGALHAVESPFFEKRFNPETSILKSIIFYWMCQYEDSKYALSRFLEKHEGNVESLKKFVAQKQINSKTAYELFEHYSSGVSSDSLEMSADILETAATTDSMMFLRGQYADVISEMVKIDTKGIYGISKGAQKVKAYLMRISKSMKTDIGNEFAEQLKLLKREYDDLYEQAQFLYVELLMSEKDHLLGKELHANSKITKVTDEEGVQGWGKTDYSYKDLINDEYWWDEIGHYIYRVKPACNI